MFKLIKCSAPGWEKEFQTSEEMKAALYSHICGLCRDGAESSYCDPVHEGSSFGELLSTGCGCEFDVEPYPL
jgi:hypothetical protein